MKDISILGRQVVLGVFPKLGVPLLGSLLSGLLRFEVSLGPPTFGKLPHSYPPKLLQKIPLPIIE